MKKNYFVTLLQITGLLLLIAGIFLGLNFIVKGVLYISIPIAVIIGTITQIIVINLCKQKRAKKNIMAAKKLQKILLFIYALLAIVSLPFFLHFLNVSKNKSHIQQHYKQDMESFNQTKTDFKKELLTYKDAYREHLEQKYYSHSSDDDETNSEVSGKIESRVNADLKPLYNANNDVDKNSKDFIDRFRGVLDYWNLFAINNYIEQWPVNKKNWENQLVDAYNKVNGELLNLSKDFKPREFSDQDTTIALNKIDWKNGVWSIAIALWFMVHFLVLLEYITIKKSSGPGKLRSKVNYDEGTTTF